MHKEILEFYGHNNIPLPAVLWLPDSVPEGVIQITHGMTEHMGRYEEFAEKMTSCGFAVAGFDLRGHGQNPGNPDVASFGEGGWEASIRDMYLFYETLKTQFWGLPHYMLGFSLGSFLLREYVSRYPQGIDGVILMGTGYQPAAVLGIMLGIVKKEIKKAGFDNTTPLVENLSFETYNKKFKPNRTSADWLCSDETEIDWYLSDPLCRKNISAGLFYDMLAAMKHTGEKSACFGWNKEMPVLLLSGKDDPVGDFGKGILKVRENMINAGMKTVQPYLLPKARHDLLHEKACGAAEDAVRIILDWIGKGE